MLYMTVGGGVGKKLHGLFESRLATVALQSRHAEIKAHCVESKGHHCHFKDEKHKYENDKHFVVIVRTSEQT